MKKQYIKPQSRIVTLKLMGSVLDGEGIQRGSIGINTLNDTDGSRQSNFFEDDEEEDNMWNSRLW